MSLLAQVVSFSGYFFFLRIPSHPATRAALRVAANVYRYIPPPKQNINRASSQEEKRGIMDGFQSSPVQFRSAQHGKAKAKARAKLGRARALTNAHCDIIRTELGRRFQVREKSTFHRFSVSSRGGYEEGLVYIYPPSQSHHGHHSSFPSSPGQHQHGPKQK